MTRHSLTPLPACNRGRREPTASAVSPRQRIGLRPPRPGDAREVPSTSRRRRLWRACQQRHLQPWWFSTRTNNDHPGRFDLERPQGTTYWALSPVTAIIESTSDPDQIDPPVLSLNALDRLSVWMAEDVAVARSKLADTTRPSVPTLTAEIGTIVPYALSWAWADAFSADGRNGLVYQARLGMGESLAVFGIAGAAPSGPSCTRRAASAYYGDLPPSFRLGVGGVGPFDQLPSGPRP